MKLLLAFAIRSYFCWWSNEQYLFTKPAYGFGKLCKLRLEERKKNPFHVFTMKFSFHHMLRHTFLFPVRLLYVSNDLKYLSVHIAVAFYFEISKQILFSGWHQCAMKQEEITRKILFSGIWIHHHLIHKFMVL